MLTQNKPSAKINYQQRAEQATIQSFLNCYLRETNNLEIVAANSKNKNCQTVREKTGVETLIISELPSQNQRLIIPVKYLSPTGRHTFSFPIFTTNKNNQLQELEYINLINLITKELSANQAETDHQDELILRVIQSCENITKFINFRQTDTSLYNLEKPFVDTEKALIFGHHLHPTPKSRQGFNETELYEYSPELKGEFQLHYFRAHQSIIVEDSALVISATNLVKSELRKDPNIDDEFKAKYCQNDEYSLIPIHPWQANYALNLPEIQTLIKQGLLTDIGQIGKTYQATSSIRTVYNSQSPYMVKLSLNVKITNSLRSNLYKELARSVEVYNLLESKIGQKLREKFPNFKVIRDPAYITIQIEGKPINELSTIFRENPFLGDDNHATCLISLCQDSIYDQTSRLGEIIKHLAKQENKTTTEISINWFRKYLQLYLKPILWLYLNYGIGLEAHQQNTVIELAQGYPQTCFYRDNQGYYYRRSAHQFLANILPNISKTSETICDDAVVDERLGYYLFLNNIFGLINAFGTAQVIDENILLSELKAHLQSSYPQDSEIAKKSHLISNFLSQKTINCKANLLTRFHNMDELVGDVATQSVYTQISNPLYNLESRNDHNYQ